MRQAGTSTMYSITKAILILGLTVAASAQRGAPQPASQFAQDQPTASNPFAQMHYRQIGPGGNRVSAVVGEPGNPNVIYAGASDGGIWKTSDAGVTWEPVF